MTLFDRSLLALPFYDDAHRELALALEDWVARHASAVRELASASVQERGRRYARLLGESGWLAYAVDAPEGSPRPDLRSVCLIREALAYLDDLLDFSFAIQGLAAAPIAWFGSPDQRERLLPALRDGSRIGSLALSEPETGSNLAALAVLAHARDGGYAVDGLKTWVSNGTIADFHCALLRTGEGPGGLGLSFLLVPADAAGLKPEAIDLLAPRDFASLSFQQVSLPATARIGEGGMGFKYAMEILNFYRVTVGAAAVGFCRRAAHAAVPWAQKRDVAGAKLIKTQFTMDKLAGLATYLDAASLLVARSAWEFDTGVKDVAAHAAMAKLYATDGAGAAADDVVQLFGAAGLIAGSVPEQVYRQVRALRIYEGTSEIQKMIIAGAVSRPLAAGGWA
ncbi:acyl-CoA dehydrogenase family protein [Orrella dioscoreae]|uniref:Acyl-CoA dehydrogenase n=1 Tax=Orrella dioscoreae TaxID=1851544 RepID=A0A1C3K873_9BURK|nr:acyl-CoA dehydrogenase family protein [Orrella dioscoreae]SBT27682.1 Acyl-CoA dehydrogenase [Orrella dioscoreae]SOE48558.1 Acyl-CoA dehydrogenase [Orrella dioscoreae]